MASADIMRQGGASTLKVCVSALLVLVLVQQQSALCHAYSLADFLAAYNNPRVSYHEVKGNIVLRASLPPLSRALTLVGKGPGGRRPVIDGASRYRGMVTSDNLKLVNIEFRRFKANQGGAVLSASNENVVIEKCAFRNNQVTGGESNGGAISFSSVSYKISKSVFSGNKAGGSGGALWSFSDGSGPIEDTVFENNQASFHGGAAASRGEIGMRFNRCRFQNNRARQLGGAIWFNRGLCFVSNSRFIGNVAGTFGGAFRFFGTDEGVLRVCRGNSYSNNRAGTRSSDNISINLEIDAGSSPSVFFCSPRPPRTLVESPAGGWQAPASPARYHNDS